jgi:hypothetical protein
MLATMDSFPSPTGASQAAAGSQGIDHHLLAVRRKHPGAQIERDNITGHWGAVERPSGGGEVFTHAPTLAELDIKLGAESSEAG